MVCSESWVAFAVYDQGVGSVRNSAKVLFLSVMVIMLSSLGLGQATFNLVKVPNSSPDSATAINNAGEVVVNFDTAKAFNVSLWSLVSGGEKLQFVGQNNVGVAVDDANDVAGVGYPNSSSQLQAFLSQSNGTTQWLPTLGGPVSIANGLNSALDVVGTSYTASGAEHAYLWSPAGGIQDLTPTLTSPGGSIATGVNSSGLVVGYYYPNGASNVLGFTWTKDGGLQSFGNPGTMALAVNNLGTIVGQELTSSGYRHAFSWTQSGGMVDLGTLGGKQSSALAINNNGWIIGTSLTDDKSGFVHGFLWTPSAGMQDFTSLPNPTWLGGGQQPYSMQLNDYGDIAFSTRDQLMILAPKMIPTVVSSANPSKVGQPVTFTATVTSIVGPPPDGETLQFVVDNITGSGTLKNGVAKCTISGIKSGSHPVTVLYAGDAHYTSFHVLTVTQVVNP